MKERKKWLKRLVYLDSTWDLAGVHITAWELRKHFRSAAANTEALMLLWLVKLCFSSMKKGDQRGNCWENTFEHRDWDSTVTSPGDRETWKEGIGCLDWKSNLEINTMYRQVFVSQLWITSLITSYNTDAKRKYIDFGNWFPFAFPCLHFMQTHLILTRYVTGRLTITWHVWMNLKLPTSVIRKNLNT